MDKRFQVRVDFIDGPSDSLVNSYSDHGLAEHCKRVLETNPMVERFIAKAWVVDRHQDESRGPHGDVFKDWYDRNRT